MNKIGNDYLTLKKFPQAMEERLRVLTHTYALRTMEGYPDYNEVYICDNCNHKLDISAKLAFTVEAYNEPEEFVSKIEKPEKIKLSEEELF